MTPHLKLISLRLIIAALLTGVALTAPAETRDVRRATSRSTGALTLLADSIDFRSDLTRIYGRLSGVPHTAGRIDMLMMQAPGGEPRQFTDIDGVDAERWFQWEDDGVIAVEIDFPPLDKVPGQITVDCVTPRGNARWFVTVSPGRAKKARGRK